MPGAGHMGDTYIQIHIRHTYAHVHIYTHTHIQMPGAGHIGDGQRAVGAHQSVWLSCSWRHASSSPPVAGVYMHICIYVYNASMDV